MPNLSHSLWSGAAPSALLLLACLQLGACTGEPCGDAAPSFQVTVRPGSGVKVNRLQTMKVTVVAGAFVRHGHSFELGQAMADGATSFVVELGQAGSGGFEVHVTVVALGASGNAEGWAAKTFSGGGDGCNFFELTLQAGSVSSRDFDGDGVKGSKDCDDMNPCRGPGLKEAANLCSTPTLPPLPDACKAWLASLGQVPTPPYCGDGVDQDCDGKDLACLVDGDCDGFAKPADCNDADAKIHPGAAELCDAKDNDCDKVTDEGCVQCDVDGDGFASPDNKASPALCKLPRTDPDDHDAGIHPLTTQDTATLEGGSVKAALRGFCSFSPAKNNAKGAPQRHRDVDHDADKLAASADGCPSEGCDRDGDGFQNKGCNPPAALRDCNDEDPRTFPGAPDLCGDGKAQNCKADRKCSTVIDADGDGYSPSADCNDGDDKIHPWAVERCDRVDNDCDGLTDEGNPDVSGNLLPTNVKLCSDDNHGLCAPTCGAGSKNCKNGRQLSGTCVCSAIKPKGARDSGGNRVKCGNEDLSKVASLRCFGATQPALEQCDAKDHDCDGKAYLKGQPFGDLGQPCGTSSGNCSVGKVTGCDPTKSVANYSLVAKVLPKFNKHWICSGTLPRPELCNGKDDDCDGSRSAAETDSDGDGYISCWGCKKGSGSTDLDPKLKGCDDCAPKDKLVSPGAKELCNNRDDNCTSGLTDDGKDQCPAAGKVCCSTQKACRDLGSDFLNCGSCGYKCSSTVSDRCKGKKCLCGSSLPCGAGLNCSKGSCACVKGGLCSGCCDGSAKCLSLASQGGSKCGKGGNPCKSCNDNNECTTDLCQAGVCANPKRANGISCGGGAGKCFNGVCCKGCIKSGSCVAGFTTAACGAAGAICQQCSTNSNPCSVSACSSGKCGQLSAPNGSGCTSSGKGGKCQQGSCCTGCWDGSTCVGGHALTKCGNGGDNCTSCPTSPCTKSNCSSGACTQTPKGNGSSCTVASVSGSCLNAVCCTGCRKNGTCYAGTADTHCGASGNQCKDCDDKSEQCVDGSCK